MKMTRKQANNVFQREAVITKWQGSPFYTKDVVLSIDIGIEGIGIAVRRGPELLYCKTLMMKLPEQAPLEARRVLRSSRRARKSRRVRMNRLKRLFQKHGLPWVDDEIMARSDPFLLRDRAVKRDGAAVGYDERGLENGIAGEEELHRAVRAVHDGLRDRVVAVGLQLEHCAAHDAQHTLLALLVGERLRY